MSKFLFLAPEFPPDKYTGSLRVSRFAKYLSKFGHTVTIIAPVTNDQTHETLLLDLRRTKITRKRPSRIPFINDHSLSFFRATFFKSIKECYASRPDYIFVSGPPYFHFLQGAILSYLFNIRLILDYRDLWTGDPYPPKTIKSKIFKKISRYLERWALSHAYLCIYVSDQMLGDQKRIFPSINDDSSLIISTGYDPDTINSVQRSATRMNVISHVGNADSDMNIGDLVSIFKDPMILNWFEQTGCRFHFVGRKNSEVSDVVAAEHKKYFLFTDYLPHVQAMEVMANSKGLLILGSNSKQRLNRKVFEYTALNKNIFFIGNLDSPTSKVLQSYNCVVSSPRNLRENFMTYVTSFDETPPLLKEMYSAENLVRKLHDRLDQKIYE